MHIQNNNAARVAALEKKFPRNLMLFTFPAIKIEGKKNKTKKRKSNLLKSPARDFKDLQKETASLSRL